MSNSPAMRALHRMAGITLVELMVALLIGSFLMLGAITVFNQSRGTYRVNESVARLQENARFAMDTLAPDVRLASFWGMMNAGELITVPGGMAVACAGNDVSAWALDLAAGTEGSNNVYDWPCDPFNNAPQPLTDALIVRHGTDRQMPLTAGTFQIQSNRVVGELFNDGGMPAGFLPADSVTHDLQVHGYYVSQQSSFDDTVPSLRRYTLVGNTMQDQEIIPGVQDLQFQYGVDTDHRTVQSNVTSMLTLPSWTRPIRLSCPTRASWR